MRVDQTAVNPAWDVNPEVLELSNIAGNRARENDNEIIFCFKIQSIPIFIIHCLNSIRITGFPALCSSESVVYRLNDNTPY